MLRWPKITVKIAQGKYNDFRSNFWLATKRLQISQLINLFIYQYKHNSVFLGNGLTEK